MSEFGKSPRNGGLGLGTSHFTYNMQWCPVSLQKYLLQKNVERTSGVQFVGSKSDFTKEWWLYSGLKVRHSGKDTSTGISVEDEPMGHHGSW